MMKPYTPTELKRKLKGHLPGTVKMSHVTDTCELCRWGATLQALQAQTKELATLVAQLQFGGYGVRKCPVCLGWQHGGEVPEQHSADCPVAAALDKYKP